MLYDFVDRGYIGFLLTFYILIKEANMNNQIISLASTASDKDMLKFLCIPLSLFTINDITLAVLYTYTNVYVHLRYCMMRLKRTISSKYTTSLFNTNSLVT